MTPKFVYMDTEFKSGKGCFYELPICASVSVENQMRSFDTRSATGREAFKAYLESLKGNYLVAFGIDTEARFINTIYRDINATRKLFPSMICLFREYKALTNCNNKYLFGEYVSETGIRKAKFSRYSADKGEVKKRVNLMNALYKGLQVYDDQQHRYKNTLRDICAWGTYDEINRNIDNIVRYCELDTRLLPNLLQHFSKEMADTPGGYFRAACRRAAYGELIARKVHRGYCVKQDEMLNIISQRPKIVQGICEHILKTWPHLKTFQWNKRENRYQLKEEVVRSYIAQSSPAIRSVFRKVTKKTGKISLSKEYFEELFPNKHDLPLDNYLAQIYRYLSTAMALRGLTLRSNYDPKKAKTWFDFFCVEEGLVRPYYNDFGSQTSRSQPSANGYLLLKPAWMRSLLVPPKDHVMITSDYTRQEILIMAIQSGDENLYQDYCSGDLYSAFGKRAGIIKGDESKDLFAVLRAACKQIVLSIQYGITCKGLAPQLEMILKQPVTEYQAQYYIDRYSTAYPRTKQFQRRYLQNYIRNKKAWLSDGWPLWGGQYNERSITNFPTQGQGGVILRETDLMADREGLWLPFTLHDAVTCYADIWNWEHYDIHVLLDCMAQGFYQGMGEHPWAKSIQMDCEVVSPWVVLPEPRKIITCFGHEVTPTHSKRYVDKRAKKDLTIYQEYFNFKFNKGGSNAKCITN